VPWCEGLSCRRDRPGDPVVITAEVQGVSHAVVGERFEENAIRLRFECGGQTWIERDEEWRFEGLITCIQCLGRLAHLG
jgi:hypothetical protein